MSSPSSDSLEAVIAGIRGRVTSIQKCGTAGGQCPMCRTQERLIGEDLDRLAGLAGAPARPDDQQRAEALTWLEDQAKHDNTCQVYRAKECNCGRPAARATIEAALRAPEFPHVE